MAVSELAREAAERKRGLTDVAKAIRSAMKAGTAIIRLITSIKKRKKGLPSMADLKKVVDAIIAFINVVQSAEKLIPSIEDIFKIIG